MNNMGIPKLTSFIRNFFSGWKEERLEGHLVIDGCSLCYHLYTFDWIHGGQYKEYHDIISEYFRALQSSAIESIVVFDGIDYTGEKSETIQKRYDSKNEKVHNQFTDTSGSGVCLPEVTSQVDSDGVLPLLASAVFYETLAELGVKCIRVDGEADKDIAQLANFYSCPVLSNDSDFFMFSLKGGFVHMDRFNWRAQPIIAEVYHVTALMDQFNLAHENLRFIIPAILGNDFLPAVNVGSYFRHIKQVTSLAVGKHHPVLPVVVYASHYDNLEDFITRLESIDNELLYLDESGKEVLRENCIKAEEMYDIQKVHSLEDLHGRTELLIKGKYTIPGWLLDQVRCCKVTDELLAAIGFSSGYMLPITMGSPQKVNPIHISRPLRRAAYSLLELGSVIEAVMEGLNTEVILKAVSYTHLTLPTIYSV